MDHLRQTLASCISEIVGMSTPIAGKAAGWTHVKLPAASAFAAKHKVPFLKNLLGFATTGNYPVYDGILVPKNCHDAFAALHQAEHNGANIAEDKDMPSRTVKEIDQTHHQNGHGNGLEVVTDMLTPFDSNLGQFVTPLYAESWSWCGDLETLDDIPDGIYIPVKRLNGTVGEVLCVELAIKQPQPLGEAGALSCDLPRELCMCNGTYTTEPKKQDAVNREAFLRDRWNEMPLEILPYFQVLRQACICACLTGGDVPDSNAHFEIFNQLTNEKSADMSLDFLLYLPNEPSCMDLLPNDFLRGVYDDEASNPLLAIATRSLTIRLLNIGAIGIQVFIEAELPPVLAVTKCFSFFQKTQSRLLKLWNVAKKYRPACWLADRLDDSKILNAYLSGKETEPEKVVAFLMMACQLTYVSGYKFYKKNHCPAKRDIELGVEGGCGWVEAWKKVKRKYFVRTRLEECDEWEYGHYCESDWDY